MNTTKENTKETLETYKASVKLNSVKVHYRYAVTISNILTAIVFTVVGYFLSLNVITDTQSKVVNSIEIVSKQ